eukprot:343033-Pleurochrysis_carterae.AAC.4
MMCFPAALHSQHPLVAFLIKRGCALMYSARVEQWMCCISPCTSSALASPGRPALGASFKVRARAFRHAVTCRDYVAMLPRHGGWTRRGVHMADRSQ